MKPYHHALRFRYDVCIGCSHCTGVCPVGAIHIEGGIPVLHPDKCIDCGRCYEVCPAHAIYIEQDDFQTVYNYKYPVLLLPSFFSAQFPRKVTHREILSALACLGFKQVFEIEQASDFIFEMLNEKLQEADTEKPAISTFCPAVVRLIQSRYPSLIPNLVKIKSPLTLTAIYVKQLLHDRGIPDDEAGVFYVTPCAAKIASIKNNLENEKNMINGVINLNFLYNKVYRIIKNHECELLEEDTDFEPLTKASLSWALTGGEIAGIKGGRNLAIDEIHNVNDFLERIENGEIINCNFLELRGCDESCFGGILCPSNRFVSAERQKKRVENNREPVEGERNIEKYKDVIFNNRDREIVNAVSVDKMGSDISSAIRNVTESMEINAGLPQVDCRICGYQTCKLFSEAIVNGEADIKQCVFVRMDMELSGKMTKEESLEKMQKVWGQKKMDKLRLRGEL